MKSNYYVDIRDYQIHLITNGKDEFDNVVLCFHGFNGDKWSNAYGGLKTRAERSLICSFDSCGHGKSPVPAETMRLDNILEEIDAAIKFIKNLCPDKPLILVGGSYGGYRIMEYLVQYGTDVDKVIYVNPAFRILERLEELKDFTYSKLVPGQMVVMKSDLNKFMSKEFLDDLYANNLYQQTLPKEYNAEIVVGKKDSLIPAADAIEISERYGYPITYVDDEHSFENKDNWYVIANMIKDIR